MDPKKLQSNEELFQYLVDLATILRGCGELVAADGVTFASRFVSGSSTEFMHESHVALTNVKKTCGSKLSRSQFEDVVSVITQIDTAFNRVGGA